MSSLSGFCLVISISDPNGLRPKSLIEYLVRLSYIGLTSDPFWDQVTSNAWLLALGLRSSDYLSSILLIGTSERKVSCCHPASQSFICLIRSYVSDQYIKSDSVILYLQF